MLINNPKQFWNVINKDPTTLLLTSPHGVAFPSNKCASVPNNVFAVAFSNDVSLDTGCIPHDWKVGRVIPLHKSGNKHCPHNFQPISLSSIPCKIMEHVICSHLVSFLESNSFFNTRSTGSTSPSDAKPSPHVSHMTFTASSITDLWQTAYV